ncbi:MAG: hypothetical protein H7X91_07130 [Burkholderiales bacterium]|nr:hypothetical protein [Burkholderiales bacterium]
MSTQSRTKPSTLLFALITAVSLATTAPFAAAVEDQMKETDGHAHDKDHHKDGQASENAASSKATTAPIAGAAQEQMKETDGHAHDRDHDKDDQASKNTASSTGMSGRAGAKSDEAEHQAEETDGHDHEAHKKEHKLDSKK